MDEEQVLNIEYELTRQEFEEELVGRELSDSEWRITVGTITEALGERFSQLLTEIAEDINDGHYE